MRSFITIVEEISSPEPKPTVLYHGTRPENLETIMREGLLREHDTSWKHFGEGVYLGTEDVARGYGSILLSIDLTKLNERLLVPDDHDLYDIFAGDVEGTDVANDYDWPEGGAPSGIFECDWLDSLKIVGQCQYLGDIPASALRIVELESLRN